MPKARIKSKLPIEIVAQRTNVITHLYATPDPRLSVRLQYRAPMSARAVAVIRPASTIIALFAFLFIPVWRRPVARLSRIISSGTSPEMPTYAEAVNRASVLAECDFFNWLGSSS
jgi:hypothetical protein